MHIQHRVNTCNIIVLVFFISNKKCTIVDIVTGGGILRLAAFALRLLLPGETDLAEVEGRKTFDKI